MAGKRDSNYVVVLMGVSSADGITPVPLKRDSVTGKLLAHIQGINAGTKMSVQPGKRDDNYKVVLLGESSSDDTIIPLTVDPTNQALRTTNL